MIGSGNCNGIDGFAFFVEHFPKIFIAFGIRVFGEIFFHAGKAPVYIAEGHHVIGTVVIRIIGVAKAFAAKANTGNVEFIAGRNKPFTTQYVPGYDKETRRGQSASLNKLTAGSARLAWVGR